MTNLIIFSKEHVLWNSSVTTLEIYLLGDLYGGKKIIWRLSSSPKPDSVLLSCWTIRWCHSNSVTYFDDSVFCCYSLL